MRNPNFLVLDEPTNDLDIITLQILEEYLQDFPGCVIVVSHDRYFMDKVIDHLLVFNGNGQIKDFPGNYNQYRDMVSNTPDDKQKEKELKKKERNTQQTITSDNSLQSLVSSKRKFTYKEKLEFERLQNEIDKLEKEQIQIEESLCSGSLSIAEITELSKRLPVLKEELDEKSMRWLELSEIGG
jgi:ATP-binding cassette subfamily F protein uup